MNFDYSEEQNLLRESIQRWAQDNYSFDQRRVITGTDDGFSREHWATFAELGWLSVPFAEEYGGYGGSIIDVAAIMQEFGKILLLEPVVPSLVLFGDLLQRSNNAALKESIIPAVIDGSVLGAVAMYEPQARFDLSNIATTAEADGDDYVLHGEKSMVLGGAHADKMIVAARSSSGQTDEAGVSLFLVDADTAGLTVKPYTLMDGQQVADLHLEQAQVAGDRLLCEAGAGYPLLEATLQNAHIALCAEALGIMERLNATTVEYTKTRKQFGVPISSFQALQHRMVDTFIAFEQAKSLLVGALCEVTDERTDPRQAAKVVAGLRTLMARNGKLIGDEAIQLHGGMGITDELDVGHYVKRLMMINLVFGNGDFFQKRFNQIAYHVHEIDS